MVFDGSEEQILERLVALNVRAFNDSHGITHFTDAETGGAVQFSAGLKPKLSASLVKRLNISIKHRKRFNTSVSPVVITIQGDLVKVEPVIKKPVQTHKSGGVEGRKITGFSRESRRRLMSLCASVEFPPGYFSTLTYDDSVLKLRKKRRLDPEQLNIVMKSDLDKLFRALELRFPEIGIIWRCENVPRKSGVYIGQMVPHAHLLLWLYNYNPDEVREYIIHKWLEYTQTKNINAHSVLNRAESWQKLDGRRQVMSYVSKYMGKIDKDYGFPCGRVWGKIGNVPVAKEVKFALSVDETKMFRRIIKRWKKNDASLLSYLDRIMFNNITCSLFISGLSIFSLIKYLHIKPDIIPF